MKTAKTNLALTLIKRLGKGKKVRITELLDAGEPQGISRAEMVRNINELERQGEISFPGPGMIKVLTPKEKIRRRPLLERKKKSEEKAWIKYGKLKEAFMKHFSMSEETANQFAIQCMQRWMVFGLRGGSGTSETKLGNLLCYYSPKTDWVDGMMDLRAKLNKELKPWEEHWKELAKMVREKKQRLPLNNENRFRLSKFADKHRYVDFDVKGDKISVYFSPNITSKQMNKFNKYMGRLEDKSLKK